MVRDQAVRCGFSAVLFCAAAFIAGCNNSTESDEPSSPDAGIEKAAGPSERTNRDIELVLKPAQLDWVGQQIFQNECAGQLKCLVHWNDGEAFPSLGIGHFIWYPADVSGRFTESFPSLIQYMIQRQASVPDWIRSLDPLDAPWPDKATFLSQENSPGVAELREFLAGTQGIQASFMFQRAQDALARVVSAVPEGEGRATVEKRLRALSSTPGGVYALVDYVNFKGEGLAESERYEDQGWGLLQVLLDMTPDDGRPALDRFREAAGRVLTRRAQNADNAIERERWLPGWLKRLDTYREPVSLKLSS